MRLAYAGIPQKIQPVALVSRVLLSSGRKDPPELDVKAQGTDSTFTPQSRHCTFRMAYSNLTA